MYAVVGCTECSALWIIETGADTAGCPRCDTRHRTTQLKHLFETESEDQAREARASMLASRQGDSETYAELEDYGTLEEQVGDGVVDDTEYLSGAGLDPESVAAAGERATTSPSSQSRREIVVSAVTSLDAPTAADIIAYAEERGVPESATRALLEKLRRKGLVTERNGSYRLL